MQSLEKKALKGSIWTVGGYGTSQVLRFLNNVILARLLTPELFGLMTLVNTFITGVQLFSDIGIGQSIVQNKRGDDPIFFNTAWTLQGIRGIGLWFVCLALTIPVANFYGEESLKYIFPVSGLNIILSGFTSTSLATLQRRLRQGRKIVFGLVVQVTSLLTMTAWALISPTIWALVAGSLVSSLVNSIGSHFLLPDVKNKFHIDREAMKELFSYGKWIFVATLLFFFAQQTDRLVLGKLVPLELLGVYGIARALSDIFRNVVLKLNNEIVFPFISRLSDIPRSELYEKVKPTRQKFLLIAGLGLAFPVCFGDVAVSVLYDDRYVDATWMLPILCLGIWFSVLFQTCESSLKGLGKPIYAAQANFVKLGTLFFGLPWSFQQYGILGCILTIAASEFFSYLAVQYGLIREQFVFLKQDVIMTLYTVGIIAIFGALRWSLGFGFSVQNLWLPG
ncbi:oligosaccharide flippase family protein [Prochlorothrix hollandica]|uniref:oligosaccharide flippase family protein n=1 Tax=Prochlorothrix hollandica TaxID=1223 RepID=UPI00333F176F